MPRLKHCTRCRLHETRNKIVWGAGDIDSTCKFCGEGPGFNEDKTGTPFCGESGKLLRSFMLDLAGPTIFKEVFITNLVLCRPPNNRDPYDDEIEACDRWLRYQLFRMKPKAIGCIGRIAAGNLIKGMWEWGVPVKKRGTVYIPIYHPAYVSRNRNNEDLMAKFKDSIKLTLELGGIL